MFVVNEDQSVYLTRGDIVFFSVRAEDDGKTYVFRAGDVLRIKIFGKKDAGSVALQKDFPVLEACESVEIFLTEEDTKLGEVISKPRDYWYEIELNPGNHPQTIIGYDGDGPRVFRLFPEGADVNEYVPEPEDFPVVDEKLDLTSPRPVANSAVARAIAQITADQLLNGYVMPIETGGTGAKTAEEALVKLGALPRSGGTVTGDLAMSGHQVTGLGDPTADGDAVNKAYADGAFPPMLAGEEYRTRERWNGKAVYTKLIGFGALPSASSKTVETGVQGRRIIRSEIAATNGSYSISFPYFLADGTLACKHLFTAASIQITTTTDYSAYTAWVRIWYTEE